jgi:hypothetical protein
MKLVLLLALVLPLQSFASFWSCGSQDTAAAAAHEHCIQPGAQQGGGEQHHHCGTCCVAAIAATALRWTPPRSVSPAASLPSHRSPPKVVLDRLDRPPRLVQS